MLHFYTPLEELFLRTYTEVAINPNVNDVDDHLDDEAVIESIILTLKLLNLKLTADEEVEAVLKTVNIYDLLSACHECPEICDPELIKKYYDDETGEDDEEDVD